MNSNDLIQRWSLSKSYCFPNLLSLLFNDRWGLIVTKAGCMPGSIPGNIFAIASQVSAAASSDADNGLCATGFLGPKNLLICFLLLAQ